MTMFPRRITPGAATGSLAALLLLAACGGAPDNSANSANAAATNSVETIEDPDALGAAQNETARNETIETAALPTDAWVGRWTGPEGLFLDIQPASNGKPGHYALTNKYTLDDQGDFPGTAEGMTIRFVRAGKDLAIRPGKGAETGFKYLADKQDCLIVVANQEGYCR
jgi:hypothetical protein